MTGPFPHQHGDPRGLRERIDRQLQERIEEAGEMAGLELLGALRKKQRRPAPEEHSAADRQEFEALAADLFASLREVLRGERGPGEPPPMDAAEAAAGDVHRQPLAGQVFLAKRLPDYWQRFNAHRAAHPQARLSEAVESAGWLRRLFARY